MSVTINTLVLCPRCHNPSQIREFIVEPATGFSEGHAVCEHCMVRSPRPLAFERGVLSMFAERDYDENPFDFSFSCDSIWVRTEGHGFAHVYRLDGEIQDYPEVEREPTVPTIYIVRHKESHNLILGVFSTAVGAEEAMVKPEDFEILEFQAKFSEQVFPVWIVSVGKDDAYRIIGVFTDRKQAAKVGSSVGGRLREYEVLPRRRRPTTIYVSKSWVVLGQHNSNQRARVIDEVSVRRRLFPGEEKSAFPIATFRRPYDCSLPNRIEVLAVEESDSIAIAKSLANLTDQRIRDTLEYNVDYKVIKNEDGIWEIDPCLLDQPA